MQKILRRMESRIPLAVLGIALLIRSSMAWDGESDTEDLFFMEIPHIMAAAKIDQDVRESSSAVKVITREQIANSQASTFADLIAKIPGLDNVFINEYQRLIGIRGLQGYNSSKTLFLIDGSPSDLDWMGTTQWNSIPIPLVAIENVEIVKSPGTLYGANALAGVINIVTRQPQERWLVEGKGLYGNGATHSEQVYLGLNTGQTKASFSGSQIASNIFSPKSTLAENQNASLFGNLMFSREWSTNQRSSLRFGFSQSKQVPQLVNPGAILMLGESKSWILDGEHEINFADQDPLKFSFTYRHYDVEHAAHFGMAEASASSGTFVGNLEKT